MAEAPPIQLSQTISTRDSTMTHHAIMYNYYATQNSDGRIFSERRFGLQPVYTATAATGLGLFTFNTQVLSIIGTTFYVNGVASGTVDGTSQYHLALRGTGAT